MSNQVEVKPGHYAFMTCLLKVNTDGPGWTKTLAKVLKNIHGIFNFRMGEDGTVAVSGRVTPIILLKALGKAGKKAELLRWQFGECSSNLFMPAYSAGYVGNSSCPWQIPSSSSAGATRDLHSEEVPKCCTIL